MKKPSLQLSVLMIVTSMTFLSNAMAEMHFPGEGPYTVSKEIGAKYKGLPFLAWTGDEHSSSSSERNNLARIRLNNICRSQGYQAGDFEKVSVSDAIGEAYYVDEHGQLAIIPHIQEAIGIGGAVAIGMTGGFGAMFYSSGRVFRNIVCVK